MAPGFLKVLCSFLSGGARAFPVMNLWDQVSDGSGGVSTLVDVVQKQRQEGTFHGSHVFPAKAASPGAGQLPGMMLLQPSLFPKPMTSFMSQLWQKMHEFISPKHYVDWKKKLPGQERWESLVPSSQRLQPLLNWLQPDTGAEAASLVP